MKCRLLTVALAVLPALSAFAQTAGGAAVPPVAKQRQISELLAAGGTVMYILLLISVVMVAVAFTLFLTIRHRAVVTDRFMSDMESALRAGDLKGLGEISRRNSQRMAVIVQQTVDFILQNPNAGMEEIREVAQTEGTRQASQLTARVSYLADIGSISPLVGLLGTVIGLTESFYDLAAGKEGVQQLELTSGISHALVNTAGGLVVAVPALMLYAFFRGKAQKLVNELEAAATHFIVHLQMLANKSRPAPAKATTTARQQTQPRAENAGQMTPLTLNPRDLHGI
ncbi:MAG: MotA/TolQ/ExbB proton channel family protein [Luteolibacter sp.]